MKPRNKFERAVLAQSKRLRPITKTQKQWAFRECIDHYAYRLPKGKTTCMDCGHSWQMIEPTERCTCPLCGADLEVITTRARKLKQRQYFTVLTPSGGYQVLRMYLLIAGMEKGYQASSSVMEIGQYWWDEDGRQSIVAVQRTMGHYIDSFAYYSPMAIRRDNEAYRFVARCSLCPKVKLSDTLKRNSFEGKCDDIAPTSLIPALLTDCRAETLMKAGRTEHLRYLLSRPQKWDSYWPAYKITLRRGYDITDIALWCDYIDMHVRIELAPNGHDLALERRRKRPETSEVHDVAVGHDFACHISGEVQHALHFHVIEGCVLGYQLTEALEAHTMTARRRSLNHHLAFVRSNAYLALAEGVTNGFVFLTHNYLRCLQLVILAPVGDVIQGKGKVCFSSSESLSA